MKFEYLISAEILLFMLKISLAREALKNEGVIGTAQWKRALGCWWIYGTALVYIILDQICGLCMNDVVIGGLFIGKSNAGGVGMAGIRTFDLLGTLLIISMVDLKHRRIPDALSVGLLLSQMIFRMEDQTLGASIPMLVSGILVLLFLGSAAWGLKGKLGMGDVKLIAVLAVTLGIRNSMALLFCSLIPAFLVSVVLLAAKRVRLDSQLPFAPFLTVGAFALVIFIT